jgi:hypothetical protein
MSNPFTAVLEVTAFAALILSGWADLILAGTWKKFYFTSGALVFQQQVSVASRHTNTPSPTLLEKRLSSCWMGSFAFKELEANQCGFRQKFFSFTWNPVTHGLIVFDTENNLITVKGYLNWSVLSLTTFLLVIYPFLLLINGITRTEFLNLFTICVIGCGLMFGIPYLIDRSRLKIIAATAAELWSRKYVNNQERA